MQDGKFQRSHIFTKIMAKVHRKLWSYCNLTPVGLFLCLECAYATKCSTLFKIMRSARLRWSGLGSRLRAMCVGRETGESFNILKSHLCSLQFMRAYVCVHIRTYKYIYFVFFQCMTYCLRRSLP